MCIFYRELDTTVGGALPPSSHEESAACGQCLSGTEASETLLHLHESSAHIGPYHNVMKASQLIIVVPDLFSYILTNTETVTGLRHATKNILGVATRSSNFEWDCKLKHHAVVAMTLPLGDTASSAAAHK